MVMLRHCLPHHHCFLLAMSILAFTSCLKTQDPGKSAAPGPCARALPAPEEVAGYATEELSEIGNYLPALDEGRLKVAPPLDWQVASRSQGYVVRFVFDRRRRVPLPRITIGARDAAANEPLNLDRENLVSFVESLMGEMDEKVLQAMDGRVEPLMLGRIPCARYVMRKKFRFGKRALPARGEVLKTIRDGRVYTVLLDANINTLVDYRADAYAVVANMRFPLAEASGETSGKANAGAGKGDRRNSSRENETAEESAPEKEERVEAE
ncbi:MAG: hypothetical protein ACQESR_26245 [Planctomycetota bacterium]